MCMLEKDLTLGSVNKYMSKIRAQLDHIEVTLEERWDMYSENQKKLILFKLNVMLEDFKRF
jgi:hypothetical protein